MFSKGKQNTMTFPKRVYKDGRPGKLASLRCQHPECAVLVLWVGDDQPAEAVNGLGEDRHGQFSDARRGAKFLHLWETKTTCRSNADSRELQTQG